MAGEVIKGSVYLNNLAVQNSPGGVKYANTIGGSNLANQMLIANAINSSDQEINLSVDNKLLIEQGKQFKVVQATFDPNVNAGNVANTINDRIATWVNDNGMRYDDFILNVNNSGGGTHDITIVIIRYF